MDARPKRKPVSEMTTDELFQELLYSDDVEQYQQNKEHMQKYIEGFKNLYSDNKSQ
jgi:ASC-1-like (ASCH) protein